MKDYRSVATRSVITYLIVVGVVLLGSLAASQFALYGETGSEGQLVSLTPFAPIFSLFLGAPVILFWVLSVSARVPLRIQEMFAIGTVLSHGFHIYAVWLLLWSAQSNLSIVWLSLYAGIFVYQMAWVIQGFISITQISRQTRQSFSFDRSNLLSVR